MTLQLMRRVMCDIINSDERFQVIEQATDGEKAYELLKKNTYDGVVLDVNMPKMDGIQLLQMLQKDKNKSQNHDGQHRYQRGCIGH